MTLPIIQEDRLQLSMQLAHEYGRSLAVGYQNADPYPHVVIDNFLPEWLAEELLVRFPIQRHPGDFSFESGISGTRKRQIQPEDCDSEVRGIFHFFNSAPFIRFLEGLTSIEGLVGDPYFSGGGYHEIGALGRLGVHADFRVNEKIHLSRRMNLLIYLNKDWKPEYGGDLELWDRRMTEPRKVVAPVFNRCVIFNTDATSYHGHPNPLRVPEGMTRKSVALYYYTASQKIYEDQSLDSTKYMARPSDGLIVRAEVARARLYNVARDWLPPVLFRSLLKLRGGANPR
jgi:hypothetical protein